MKQSFVRPSHPSHTSDSVRPTHSSHALRKEGMTPDPEAAAGGLSALWRALLAALGIAVAVALLLTAMAAALLLRTPDPAALLRPLAMGALLIACAVGGGVAGRRSGDRATLAGLATGGVIALLLTLLALLLPSANGTPLVAWGLRALAVATATVAARLARPRAKPTTHHRR